MYEYIYNYLLYKQNILISKTNISEKEKKQIIFTNRFLLGYLRNHKKELGDEEKIVKKLTHGELKYLFTEGSDTLFYVPNEDSNKKLYKVYIMKKYKTFGNAKIDFLERVYSEDFKKDFKEYMAMTELKTDTQIIKFPNQLPENHIFSNYFFKIVLQNTPYVQLLFSRPTSLMSLSDNFNKLHIRGPIEAIDFNFLQSLNNSNSSLSLQLLIDEKTNDNSFADISKLDHLKKLTLNFDKNSFLNKACFFACPENLETLILKNCGHLVFIPKKLKNLKIISPEKDCRFKITDSTISHTLTALSLKPLQNSLDTLCIENDQNDYLKNILFKLEIPQLPKNLIIKNCSYKTLVPYQDHPQREKLKEQLGNLDQKKLLEND